MKARLIVEAEGRNGKIPAGTEIEDRMVWIHCLPGHLNSPAIAEPVDDECREKVAVEMGKRKAALADIQRAVRQPSKDKATKEFKAQLADAHGADIAELRS